MIVFDLREEARLISFLYLFGGLTLAFGAAALVPRALSKQLYGLSELSRPLSITLAVLTAILAGAEFYERHEADALVEQCLAGGCTVVEGQVSGVEPLHKVTSGGRYTQASWGGSFWVGDTLYAHYPRDFSSYSPVNHLRNGQRARVYILDESLVLVEVMD
ncbi:hypothetical protein MTBLM1_80054 [Rhodospirillaceae bacterium LM-1]|nr:hypothetical protein MTBLM1_80054 [Rhodospirillaceae bacterium LM-1]